MTGPNSVTEKQPAPAGNAGAAPDPKPPAPGGEAALAIAVETPEGVPESVEVPLDPAVFRTPVNPALHYDAVRQYMAGRRSGDHATRNRALVAGGGRKPWRQKGTGNARVGSRRNPLWRGGGVVFGPEPRDYSYRLPGRMQRGALRSALSLRASEGKVRVFEDFGLGEPSTRTLLRRLAAWSFERGRALIIEASPSDELYLSARNLKSVEVVSVAALHCYQVLKAGTVFIRRSALETISAKLAESGGTRWKETA